MDDPFANMDPAKRRRGSLDLLRALYPELFSGEPPSDESTPETDDAAAPTSDEENGPSTESDPDASACLSGHRGCRCGNEYPLP